MNAQNRREWTIRSGRVEEVDALVRLRRTMFESMGVGTPEELDRLDTVCRDYFVTRLSTGAFRAWVADVCGEPVASIGLVIHRVPPSPTNLDGRIGYIMNLVTYPAWRRRGIAESLLIHVLDVLCAEGVPVAGLHASSDGRALYERLGFCARDETPEMRLRIPAS